MRIKLFLDSSQLSKQVVSRLDPCFDATRELFRADDVCDDTSLVVMIRCALARSELREVCGAAEVEYGVGWLLVSCLSGRNFRILRQSGAFPGQVLWEDEVDRLPAALRQIFVHFPVRALVARLADREGLSPVTRAALCQLAVTGAAPRTVQGLAARLDFGERTLRRHWEGDFPAGVRIKRILELLLLERWAVLARHGGAAEADRRLHANRRTIRRVTSRVLGATPSQMLKQPALMATEVRRLLSSA